MARILATSEDGLGKAEARDRLAEVGPNLLLPPKPVSWLKVLADQVRSLVVLLLIAVFFLTLFLQDYLEAVAVGAVLLVNISIGFITELRARRAMESLSKMQVHAAHVVRDGQQMEIDARELVPGDALVLQGGEAVAADARIFRATELQVNEAPLSGESLPVAKAPSPLGDRSGRDVPLADRSCMVYKGTTVAAGGGLAYVVGTGRDTEIGRVSELIRAVEEAPTPLEMKLAVLGKRLIGLTLAVASGVTLMGIAQGRDPWLMVETGIALAIAAVPEGLPVVATIALAVGLQRMARRRALVRRLLAVEGLGSVTVICADKTGTLTTGDMTVTRIEGEWGSVRVTGAGRTAEGDFRLGEESVPADSVPGLNDVLRAGILANRAALVETRDETLGVGDPTEVALLVAGKKAGLAREELLEAHPEVASLPFSSERLLMATFHGLEDGTVLACVKGAPSRILNASTRLRTSTGIAPMDQKAMEAMAARNQALAGAGLRVLAVSERVLPPGHPLDEGALEDLTFLGLVGISDPPAPGVAETLETFRTAGIRTIMITGDQARTARTIADEVGLLGDGRVVTAPDFTREDAGALFDEDVRVFARVTPGDKLAIVEGLQKRGEIVAMLGDGINDAPAIKQADVGVAMGLRGTDVAKETAELVLQDDRFETVGVAVEEGRVIFENIRKFVFYLFSCNLSEVGVLSLAGFTSLPTPLLPLQILWLNLITDVFPALALAVEPPEEGVMRRPPRDPSAAVMSGDFIRTTLAFGALLTVASGGAFLIALLWMDASPRVASTVAFQTLAMSQLIHAWNARTVGPVHMSQLWTNRWMIGAAALTVLLQVAAVTHPALIEVLATVHISEVPWGLVLAASLLPLVTGQLWKRRGTKT